MSSKALKGLTIKIGGDTSELSKALAGVEKQGRSLSSELGEINKLLKLDPGNTELLAQKQKVLAGAVATTKAKLDTLKEAEKQVQAQFEKGEVSEAQVRALQREIVATENKLKSYGRAVKETNRALEDHGDESRKTSDDVEKLADASKEAEQASGGLGRALGAAAKVGLAAVGAAVGAVVTGLTAAAEGSREYRTEMGKLTSAFSANSFSADTASKTYASLQGVIGETDQSVEAAQQISLLAESEKDAAAWADLAAGVVGQFGDALQPETFYEAANETIKLGEATGAFTQMLEGTGLSVEDFNAGLAACNTEQEKQAYMLEVTQGALGDAGERYKEVNAEVIRANEANDQWMQSLAGVGGAIEPIITDVKMMGASLLSELVPGVEALSEAFRGVLNGDEGAADALGEALSGIITDLLNKVVELAPTLLNVAMSLITTLVTTLLQQLPQLVSTGIELLVSVIDGITQAIPQVVQALVDMIPKLVQALVTGIPMLIDGAVQLLLAVCEAVPVLINALIPQIPTIVMSIVDGLLDNLDELLDGAITLLMAIVQAVPVLIKTLQPQIPAIVQKVIRALIANIPALLRGAVELFMAIIQAIPEIVKQMRKNVPQIIKAIVKGLTDGISDISAVGGDLIRGLWNGIKDMTSWITKKLSSFGDTVMSGIKKFFGIKSPSRVMAKEVGRFLPAGLAMGIEDNADAAIDSMTALSDDMLGEAERLNGVTLERRLHNTFDPVPQGASMESGLLGKLDSILAAIQKGQILLLDGDALVGATANKMDNALGRRRALAARGAI